MEKVWFVPRFYVDIKDLGNSFFDGFLYHILIVIGH